LSSEIQNGLVRILQPDGKTTSGTGFILSDSGLIATCSHVIQDEKLQFRSYPRPEKVAVVFHATGEHRFARVLPEGWRSADMEDVAILQLEGSLPSGVMHLSLGTSEGSGGHPFKTFGFPDFNPNEGISGDGHIMEPTSMQGMKVLQVSSPQVTPGFSGAPVLDTVSRRVVGMITSIAAPDKFGRLAETAFITPTEALITIYPQLMPSDVRPYLGLAAFAEKDAEFFFGRRKVIDSLVEALRSRPRFLLVMGPSGSGKSSVVQAGLIPKIRKGTLPGSDRWSILVVRPANVPFEQLEKEGLKGASQSLEEAARRWLRMQTGQERLFLVLDQFEEFLVTCPQPMRQKLWSEINALSESDIEVIIMAVMRDDFYSRFAQDAPRRVLEWTQRGYSQVTSNLDAEDLREIIQEPARRIGLGLEEGLTDIIINDVIASCQSEGTRTGRSTILPLLEFALTQLWGRREHGILTHQAYNSIGKVTGSLTAWADQVCRSLEKDGLGSLTRRIFTDLVNLGDESQRLPDSRRRRTLEDLCHHEDEREPVHRIVQRLADARLVTTSTDKGQVTVEIIHDSLIREWARLQRWLKKDRSFLAWERELEKDAQEWKDTSPQDAAKRDDGRLLRGLRLGEAERWLKERKGDLNEAEIDYVWASVELREREKEREVKARTDKERTRRRIVQGLAAFSVVALMLFGMAIFEWNQANIKADESLAFYLASQSDQIDYTKLSSINQKIALAVESLRHAQTWQGDLALRQALLQMGIQIAKLPHEGQLNSAQFSPDGTKVVTASYDNTARIWDAKSGKELYKLPHEDSVYSAQFSPDGTKVVTTSDDNKACIWDASSGKELFTLPHRGRVYSAQFSLNGTKVVTACHDNTSLIWDANSGRELSRLPHEGPVIYAQFSPDGTRVVTTSADNTARIWDASSGRELYMFPHESEVNSAQFSPDGTKVITSSHYGTARIWDAKSGKELYKLPHGSTANSAQFSPDGTKVVTASLDKTARIWDATSGKELYKLPHESEVNSAQFSPDGTKVVTASLDKTARIWDAKSGKELYKLPHEDSVESAQFSPDGTKVVTASYDKTARIWDTSSGQELQKLHNESMVYLAEFSPDGTKVMTAGGFSAQIWDASSSLELYRLLHEGQLISAQFSSDGTKVVTASLNNTVRIWDAKSGKELQKLIHETWVDSAQFSPDGTKVITVSENNTGQIEHTVRIWDASSGRELQKLPHEGLVESAQFSPDGTKVITSTFDGTARIWDAKSGKELRMLPHESVVHSAQFSPDGTKVVTASHDKTARIWDAKSGKELQKLPHEDSVESAQFSPDGTKVVTTSENNAAWIWDAKSGKEPSKLPHEDRVNSAQFSPDGTKVVTASYDKMALIWDAKSGKELQKLPHESKVYSAQFSPDGTKVVTAAGDDTARIWLVSPRELMTIACSRITENLTVQEWKLYGLDESECKTCPREGKFNRSLSAQLMGILTGSGECQPCGGKGK
jgi:WD40 repeat protein